jgi:hypothetical protein
MLIAFVLYNYYGKLYINGDLASFTKMITPSIVQRTSNFFGRSNKNDSKYINAILDDFRLYRGAMSAYDVQYDYNMTSIGGNLFKLT